MKHPFGSDDVEHSAHLHRLLQQDGEAAAVIVAAIAEEVGLAAFTAREAEEAGLNEVADVDKRDDLRRIAHGKVHMLADAVGHQEVVPLTGAIDARRTQHDIVEMGHTRQ